MFEKLKELWNKYWDWLMSLPDVSGILLGLLPVCIPILVCVFGSVAILDSHFKTECLDSQLARRWAPSSETCEEYHDGEWIEADLSGDSIYYYNGAASREVGSID